MGCAAAATPGSTAPLAAAAAARPADTAAAAAVAPANCKWVRPVSFQGRCMPANIQKCMRAAGTYVVRMVLRTVALCTLHCHAASTCDMCNIVNMHRCTLTYTHNAHALTEPNMHAYVEGVISLCMHGRLHAPQLPCRHLACAHLRDHIPAEQQWPPPPSSRPRARTRLRTVARLRQPVAF